MNTNGVLTLVFGVLACIFLLVTILTSNTAHSVHTIRVSKGYTTTNVATTKTVNVTTWHNETQYVQTNRTVENRQMEKVVDLPLQQQQWGASPGAFLSSWNTEVNLTYSPVMSNAPLTGRGKHSGAPKPVLTLEDSPDLSYNLNTTMWQKDNDWSPNNATMTFKR